tara:strand:+ start:90 stop:1373 length:1284 start_codon:yes stop_codon:yes gene_type:complete
MGGGIMQLVKSEEDNYLIGNPKITFFKVVYHRHTNFAMESIEIPLNSEPTFNESKITSIIPKSADLLHKMHYDIFFQPTTMGTISNWTNWTNATGYAYIKEISIELGSQQIDKHYSEWFDIWNELTDVNMNAHKLVNKHDGEYLTGNQDGVPPKLQMYVPLQFWFCKHPGLALPLISLQNIDVKLITTFRKLDYLLNCDGTASANQTENPTVKLYGDFIYLDTDERRKFSIEPQEYLIEQVQYLQPQSLASTHNLDFNHHVKEIIWVCRDSRLGEIDPTSGADSVNAPLNVPGGTFGKGNDYFNYTISATNTNPEYIYGITSHEHFNTATITIEGSNRFSPRKASYFRNLQHYNHHSSISKKGIYVYSFALNPEEYQPTGFINFSKLNNVNLELTNPITSNMEIIIFAVNYNVLKISDGYGGLAYVS